MYQESNMDEMEQNQRTPLSVDMNGCNEQHVEFKTVDEILKHAGSYGRYQILLTIALCISMIPLAFPVLIMYFVALEPPWRCVANSSVCTFNRTMMQDEDERCFMPRSEWEFVEARHYSIITQFDIFCDRKWIIHLTTSALFIGWGTGSIIFGWIADNYGRRITLYPNLFLVITVNLLSAFSTNAITFTTARFFIGFFLSGAFYQLFVCMGEFTSSKYRPFGINMIKCSFPIALCILAGKAYFIREWKTILIICSAPYMVVVGFIFFVPESFRWLHSNNKNDELAILFRKIARWNRKSLPASFSLYPIVSSRAKSSPLDLFRPTKRAITTVIHGYAWLVLAMVFFGLTLAASDLGGSIYLNFVLISLSEIPGSLITIYLCNVLGRKKTVCACTVVASAFCIGVTFFSPTGNLKIARVIFGMIGKISVSTAFSAILIWSLEVYPTNTRALANGVFQLTSRIGSASAPWIAKALNTFYHGAPFLVMGISLLIGAFMLVALPESKEMSTTETADDGL